MSSIFYFPRRPAAGEPGLQAALPPALVGPSECHYIWPSDVPDIGGRM